MTMKTQLAARGLPASPEAERFLLGSMLLDPLQVESVEGAIAADDFSLEKHQRIFNRMIDLRRRGEQVNQITLYNELDRHGEAQACGGLGYLHDLTEGIPMLPNLDGHLRIIKDKSTLRRTVYAARDLAARCIAASDDAHEILADGEAILARLACHDARHGQWAKPGDVMRGHAGGINAFLDPPKGGIGIPMPWPGMNAKTGGLHRGELVILGGRPSMGKTAAELQIAAHAAAKGTVVAFFSLEMPKDALVRRLIAAEARVNHERIRHGGADAEERRRIREAVQRIDELTLFIDDSRANTAPAITNALRKLMAAQPARLVVIDHLQLMHAAGRYQTRHHELSEISHSLKHLAVQLDFTVLVASQLSRECEKDHRLPQLSDLRESGSIEEDADAVLFIHRPEVYNRRDRSLRGQAEFILAKQRNGPIGKRYMLFRHEYQRFEETTNASEMDE